MKRLMLASAISGLALSLAFPPQRLDLLAWTALVPFLWAISASARPTSAAICGLIFGLAFFSTNTSWIFRTLVVHGHFGFAAASGLFVAMMLTLALFPALFAYLTKVCAERGFSLVLTAPFIWVFTEFLRSTALTGFPWDLAGYSQTGRLSMMQISDVTGVYGVSFVIVLVNAFLWRIVQRLGERPARLLTPMGAIALSVSAVLAYGHVRLAEFPKVDTDAHSCKIGALQGNVPQEIKWDRELRHVTTRRYYKLGKEAVSKGAQLLIWPETSVPVVFDLRNATWRHTLKMSELLGVPMLVGAPAAQREDGRIHFYNSAFLIDRGSIRFRYDKIHLVPFGEYVPFSWLLPVGPGIAAREADFSPGKDITVMSVDGCPKFGVLICYEVIFPELARRELRKGAQTLVNITNDGWFGDTAAPYQHYEMAKVRAIENRVWLIRCANTGVSGVFDPAGRERARLDLKTKGAFVTPIPLNAPKSSPYRRFGDLFAWACVGITAIFVLCSFVARNPSSARKGV